MFNASATADCKVQPLRGCSRARSKCVADASASTAIPVQALCQMKQHIV
jgi:hypothetical protein